jgi:hypothetical protein
MQSIIEVVYGGVKIDSGLNTEVQSNDAIKNLILAKFYEVSFAKTEK